MEPCWIFIFWRVTPEGSGQEATCPWRLTTISSLLAISLPLFLESFKKTHLCPAASGRLVNFICQWTHNISWVICQEKGEAHIWRNHPFRYARRDYKEQFGLFLAIVCISSAFKEHQPSSKWRIDTLCKISCRSRATREHPYENECILCILYVHNMHTYLYEIIQAPSGHSCE